MHRHTRMTNAIPFNEYEDIEAELKVMAIENYRLDAASFMKIKNISNDGRKTGGLQKKFNEYYPVLLVSLRKLN